MDLIWKRYGNPLEFADCYASFDLLKEAINYLLEIEEEENLSKAYYEYRVINILNEKVLDYETWLSKIVKKENKNNQNIKGTSKEKEQEIFEFADQFIKVRE